MQKQTEKDNISKIKDACIVNLVNEKTLPTNMFPSDERSEFETEK